MLTKRFESFGIESKGMGVKILHWKRTEERQKRNPRAEGVHHILPPDERYDDDDEGTEIYVDILLIILLLKLT